MIDFENYKRLTERTKHGIAVLDSGGRFVLSCGGYATAKALNRLAELEDLIEKKQLIPNCIIIKGDLGEWYVVHFNSGLFNAYQCRTRQEAEMKKEELMECEEE